MITPPGFHLRGVNKDIMLPIVFPVIIYVFVPKIAKKILDPLHFAITHYGNYINMVILFGFAFYLLYKSFAL